jgi:hypothetical protein
MHSTYRLWLDLAKAIIPVLESAARTGEVRTALQQQVVFESSNSMSSGWVQKFDFSYLLLFHRSKWDSLPEVKSLVEALRLEGTIYIPKMMNADGTPHLPTHEEQERFLLDGISHFFASLLERHQKFQIDEDQFGEHVDRWHEVWHTKTVPHEIVIPLRGVLLADGPIVIDKDIEIVALSPEDKTTLHQTDPFGRSALSAQNLRDCSAALRARYTSTSPTNFDSSSIMPSVETALLTIRLMKEEGVFPLCIIDSLKYSYIGTSGSTSLPESWYVPASQLRNFTISGEDATSLQEMYARLSRLKSNNNLIHIDVGIRRFEMASYRANDDDKLVDITIALESLLLYNEKDELKYRLALRGACALRATYPPSVSSKMLRKIYDIRSGIVHSGKNLSSFTNANGLIDGLLPGQFLSQALSWTRQLIVHYISLLDQGETLQKITSTLDNTILEGMTK